MTEAEFDAALGRLCAATGEGRDVQAHASPSWPDVTADLLRRLARGAGKVPHPDFDCLVCTQPVLDEMRRLCHGPLPGVPDPVFGMPVYVAADRAEGLARCRELEQQGRKPRWAG